MPAEPVPLGIGASNVIEYSFLSLKKTLLMHDCSWADAERSFLKYQLTLLSSSSKTWHK
jgi:hypothetical protein